MAKKAEHLVPAETLGNLPKAVDRKKEGGIAIAAQATQELASWCEALLCGCVFCYHGDGVKQKVLQVVAEVLFLEELQIRPTIEGWGQRRKGLLPTMLSDSKPMA